MDMYRGVLMVIHPSKTLDSKELTSSQPTWALMLHKHVSVTLFLQPSLPGSPCCLCSRPYYLYPHQPSKERSYLTLTGTSNVPPKGPHTPQLHKASVVGKHVGLVIISSFLLNHSSVVMIISVDPLCSQRQGLIPSCVKWCLNAGVLVRNSLQQHGCLTEGGCMATATIATLVRVRLQFC